MAAAAAEAEAAASEGEGKAEYEKNFMNAMAANMGATAEGAAPEAEAEAAAPAAPAEKTANEAKIEALEAENAATKGQLSKLSREQAVVKLQAFVRGYQDRTHFKAEKGAAQLVQRMYRGHVARQQAQARFLSFASTCVPEYGGASVWGWGLRPRC